MFSGGGYDEVARWLRNFLTSHAKRENARSEVVLEAGDEREGRSYAARVSVGTRIGPAMEFDYREVAERRGTLAWCRALAERTRRDVRALGSGPVSAAARAE